MAKNNKVIALDLETHRIGIGAILPKPIVCSYATDRVNTLIKPDLISALLVKVLEEERIVIGHNIAFDLGVIYTHISSMRSTIWDLYDKELVFDTMLSAKLKDLAFRGLQHEYSLAALTNKLLGIELEKNEAIRLAYGELNEDISSWPQEFKDYALKDSKILLDLYEVLKEYNDPLSSKAAFAFQIATYHGFLIDKQELSKEKERIEKAIEPIREFLVGSKYMTVNKKGQIKKETKKLRELVETLNADAKRSPKGLAKVGTKDIQSYDHPITKSFAELGRYTKDYETYIPALEEATPTIHPNFNALVSTGRSSSFGSRLYPSCNIQNIPREGRMRECFVARPGYTLVSIDYGALELCSVAQQLQNVFGSSSLADALNIGDTPVDLHSALGVYLYNKDKERDVSLEHFMKNKHEAEFKHYRTLAKPTNLGYPGGLGPNTMVEYAKTIYGVEISLGQAHELRDSFFEKYPDLAYFMRTVSSKYKTGRTIYAEKHQKDIDEYAYTVNGRTRGGCSYTSFCNGFLMQSLSADGAKLSTYNVCKFLEQSGKGKLLAFIHDELLCELSDDDFTNDTIEKISYIMIDSMQTMMPDVRISVEAANMGPRWLKNGPFISEKKFWRNQRC